MVHILFHDFAWNLFLITVAHYQLIHSGRVTQWYNWTVPSHYLNQCWLNLTLGNKFQWNLNRNSIIFIQENSFENAVCQNDGHFVQGETSQIGVNPPRMQSNTECGTSPLMKTLNADSVSELLITLSVFMCNYFGIFYVYLFRNNVSKSRSFTKYGCIDIEKLVLFSSRWPVLDSTGPIFFHRNSNSMENDVTDCRYRRAMTKLCSSSHTLEVELGRYIQDLRPTYAKDCVLYVTSSKMKYTFSCKLQTTRYWKNALLWQSNGKHTKSTIFTWKDMFLLAQNLDKLVTTSLLIRKILKIPDVF